MKNMLPGEKPARLVCNHPARLEGSQSTRLVGNQSLIVTLGRLIEMVVFTILSVSPRARPPSLHRSCPACASAPGFVSCIVQFMFSKACSEICPKSSDLHNKSYCRYPRV
jgi:hypothetical protein